MFVHHILQLLQTNHRTILPYPYHAYYIVDFLKCAIMLQIT